MISLTRRLALPLVLLALSACPVPKVVGDNPDDTTTADTPGMTGPEPTGPGPGMTTDPGESGTDDTEGPSRSEFMAMEECDIAEVCPLWTQNFAEGDFDGVAPETPGRLCVWEGLGAGTVGRYRYETGHEFTNGQTKTTTIVHVHAERKLTFVRHHLGNYDEGGTDVVKVDDYDPAMTCTLAAPELFETCLTDAASLSSECYWLSSPFDQGSPWFTDCVAQGPMCE